MEKKHGKNEEDPDDNDAMVKGTTIMMTQLAVMMLPCFAAAAAAAAAADADELMKTKTMAVMILSQMAKVDM